MQEEALYSETKILAISYVSNLGTSRPYNAGFQLTFDFYSFFRNLKTCAWSKDGKSLAISVEDSLSMFSWDDLRKPNNFTFTQWNSLQLTGKITCIAPWQSSSFIIATELPLDKLCGNSEFKNDSDVFEVKNEQGSSDGNNGKGSRSSTVHPEDVDFTFITSNTGQDVNSLFKLKLRTPQFEACTTLAQIIAICCEETTPKEICRSSLQGLVSPDLLLFQVCITVCLI